MPSSSLFANLLRNLVTVWALIGGLILLFIVFLNVSSIIGGIFLRPLPGDFELTKIGVAVAVFCFLPYCQLHRQNVSADIFTLWVNVKTRLLLNLIASILAFLFSILLVWRMFEGMLDQKAYNYTTTILQFPIWIAFIPVLFSLSLLACASIFTLKQDWNSGLALNNRNDLESRP